MADIHIHRPHRLGLAEARKLARQWTESAGQKFDMTCTLIEGDTGDVVEFKRDGVQGRFVVAADSFDLTATLGFLFGAFRGRIESEIEANLDALLSGAATAKPAARRAGPGVPAGAIAKPATKAAAGKKKG
ncbi:MAG: polyhydroxyalkanoic acid system family protein [Pseudomonadota bacterium]|nr:polyhydroxyalkanoic acid system family protein [Pseudomonadota bacterium]